MARGPLSLAATEGLAARYCSLRERCEQEVRLYLKKKKIDEKIIEEVIPFLVAEDYLNEARFAKAFAYDHFKFQKWGALKIKAALCQKKINKNLIDAALGRLGVRQSQQMVNELAAKKWRDYPRKTDLQRKQTVFRYLTGKGFPADQIWVALNLLLRN